MHIVVCVKAVADRLPDLGSYRNPDAGEGLHMNEWDSVAVEAALQFRSREGETRVSVLTAGPPSWEGVLRRALGMGVDGALRVEHQPDPAHPAKTARALASGLRTLEPDIILCGAMGEDGMQAATPPMLAAALDLPFCTMAMALDLEQRGLKVSCEAEGGKRKRYFLPLPCLVSVQTGMYAARYPRLSLMLKADKAIIPVLAFQDDTKSGIVMEGFDIPPPSRRVRFLEGSAEEKAAALLGLLTERGWLDHGNIKEDSWRS